MKHYVLVHGAWEGSWSWDETRPGLEAEGHKVTTVDLPGSPGNPRPIAEVTMESYVQAVVKTLDQLDHKIILVGHSLAGAVISQVAEQRPEKIERLVYVAAFLLKSGDSILEAMQRDPDGEFLPELIFAEDNSYATATEQTWREKAFHDVAEPRILKALPLVDVGQSTEPFLAKVVVSAQNFGAVPKTYIRTSIDKMVSPMLQEEMIGNWEVEKVSELVSGHFPTLSSAEELAALML